MRPLVDKILEVQVCIAEYKVVRSPGKLITLGLGSCIGVGIFDPVVKIGGLLHLMLPDSTSFKDTSKPAKFADLGIPLMLEEMVKNGASIMRMQAKLVGGAQMFTGMDEKMVLNIGMRNVEKVREILQGYKIKILSEEVGGNRGRTMILDTATGKVTIRMLGNEFKVI